MSLIERIERDPPAGLTDDARELGTVCTSWSTILLRLDRDAAEAWIAFASGYEQAGRFIELSRECMADAAAMYAIGYGVLQAYARLLLHSERGRTLGAPGGREPEWWGAMLGALEPAEPEGPRRAAWRYLDLAMIGARERLVAHRTVAHIDELAFHSDRTVAVSRRPEAAPTSATTQEVTELYRDVVGGAPAADVDDAIVELVRRARDLTWEQRRELRRMFIGVGYPPIAPASITDRVCLLLRPLAGSGE